MKTFNSPTHALGTINLTKPVAVATVGTFNLSKNDVVLVTSSSNRDLEKELIKRMRKTLVPFTGKIIKSNKL